MGNQDKNDYVQIWAAFETRKHFDSRTKFWNKTFLPFKEVYFSELKTSKIFEPSSSSFFNKMCKIWCRFQMQ